MRYRISCVHRRCWRLMLALTAGPAIGQTAKAAPAAKELDAAEDTLGRSGSAGNLDR